MKKYSIVMIDDDKEFLEEFEPILTDNYFEVHTATTGKKGIDLIKTIQPAVVLLDKKLPDGDGQSMVKNMKIYSKDSSFILITAYADMESVVNGLREGLSDYIIKPTKPATLLKQIYKALQVQAEKEGNLLKIEELMQANEKYKASDDLKSSFVANVSHELIGPLGILKDGLGITREKLSENMDPFAKKSLEICEAEINRLIRFTKNMLSISKIESGKMPCNKIETNISKTLSEIVEFYKPEFDKKNILLKIDIKNPELTVLVDQDMFKEIIINLITNALKHSDSNQTVSIRAFSENKFLKIEVEDEGSGISKDDLSRIFDKYFRVFADKTEGTGLGLPLVKEMVELHGGQIKAESKFKKGTKFTIYLPLEA